jgi:hypothetical protein
MSVNTFAYRDSSRRTGGEGRTANSSRVAVVLGAKHTLDAISPELVLVDPELARDDRTWLREPAWRRAPDTSTTVGRRPHRARRAVGAASARGGLRGIAARSGEHVVLVLLAISLLANGILSAMVLSGTPTTTTVAVVTQPAVSSATPRASSARSSSATRPQPRSSARPKKMRQPNRKPRKQTTPRAVAAHLTRAAVERLILRDLIQSPARKLPSDLIDQTTGLAKNNLQAVCRPTTRTSYACVVRPSRHNPSEGLIVRYRVTRDGRGVLTWGRYRAGSS